MAAVIVDAEKIERGAAELHIAGLDAHEVERIFAGKGFGIFAAERGVGEPDVAERVGAISGLAIGVPPRLWRSRTRAGCFGPAAK